MRVSEVGSRVYDYIVVGGGTAGCVLASRLSSNPSVSVLVVERGPNIDTCISRIPLISSNFSDQKAPVYKWDSTPLQGLGGRILSLASGKALGGTTKLNGLIYSRSVPGEYNAWAKEGRAGWGWKDVERLFEKSESSLSHGRSTGRGISGPWKNQSAEKIRFKPVQLNVDIATSMAIPLVEPNDPNAPMLSCSLLDATIDEKKQRCSTDRAFLPKSVINQRKNLSICTGTIATGLDIKATENGGLHVVGVHLEAESDSERQYYVSCTKEIILCAGAVRTPQLLLLSGIGPEAHLRAMGVRVLKHLPGVGARLQDHISVPLLYKTPVTDSIEVLMAKPLVALKEFLQYIFLNGRGILGQQVQQSNIILRSIFLDDHGQIKPDIDPRELDGHLAENIPDVEVMFLPVSPVELQFDGLGKSFGAFSYLCTVLRPKSFGSLRLASLDPRQQPLCDLGTLSDAEDFVPLRKSLRFALSLAERVRKTGYPLQDLSVPADTTDGGLDSFTKENAMTTYHYSSTCRMDTAANMGVVDDELRVHGLEGLRTADASIFPSIPACHLQAPVVMVAEKCAELILGS